MANEFRVDPVTGDVVIISTGRAARPTDFIDKPPEVSSTASCPFCPGNEKITPPTISYRAPAGMGESDWHTRCFDNKFSALDHDEKRPFKWTGTALFFGSPAFGKHEVVVETRAHGAPMGSLTEEQFADAFEVQKERFDSLRKDFKYVLVFQNYGKDAGASLSHLHTQIAAFPLVPSEVRRKLKGVARYKKATGRCIYCDTVKAERKAGERMVFETQDFAVICPWASAFKYQTMVIPKKHVGGYDFPVRAFSGVMRRLILAYEKVLGSVSYNYVVHVSPKGKELHFHLDFLPKLSTPAGVEKGAGIYINSIAPEEAAKALREALPPE